MCSKCATFVIFMRLVAQDVFKVYNRRHFHVSKECGRSATAARTQAPDPPVVVSFSLTTIRTSTLHPMLKGKRVESKASSFFGIR